MKEILVRRPKAKVDRPKRPAVRHIPQETPIEPMPMPHGWGKDSLSELMQLAHQNRWVTFINHKGWFQRLAAIDDCFMRVSTDWVNPANLLTPFFFHRSRGAYIAACEHAMAGQVAETYPQIRTGIEYAAYGLHIHSSRAAAEVWLRRHDDASSMKAAREEFRIANVRATVEKANRGAAKAFDLLYQRAVDHGAHPNEMAITGNLVKVDWRDRTIFEQTYLHGDGLPLQHALKTTAQAGVCALEILQEAFRARFELLGVRAELLRLRRGL